MKMKSEVTVMIASLALSFATVVMHAQAPKPVTQAEEVSTVATIEAIDMASRAVVLKLEDGTTDTIYCGPDVQRFNELKVGDRVKFTYRESVVYAIAKPGTAAPVAEAKLERNAPTATPGGTLSQSMTATVTVLAVDAKVPSITIKSEDGRTMSSKVRDKKNLEGVKVGDKVQVTFTRALAINVEPAAK